MNPSTSTMGRPEVIGIVGSGHAGQALARVAVRAGREAILANSRGPGSLASVVTALGAGVSPGTVADAVGCPMVALAVPWTSVPAAVRIEIGVSSGKMPTRNRGFSELMSRGVKRVRVGAGRGSSCLPTC